MRKEEIKQLQDVGIKAPTPPIRFTIDGEPFEFSPLPLGTLLIIEKLKGGLAVNQKFMEINPLVEWFLVCRKHTDVMRRIVALLTLQGNPEDLIRERGGFLREHCTVEDLCALFLIGTMAQHLWLRDAGTETVPADLDGITEDDFWNTPYVKLYQK